MLNKVIRVLRDKGPGYVLRASSRKLTTKLADTFIDPKAAQDEQSRQHIPTMLKRAECRFLYNYAAKQYTGAGEIVDLGCWLGGSTAPLVQGLARNKNAAAAEKKIHAYDQFIWSPWMADTYSQPPFDQIKPGESFLPLFRQNLGDLSERVNPVAGNLNESQWSAEPVEFLFVDVMKSFDLANKVIKLFFHCLQPGVSRVVHQDFVHFNTPWILLLTYRFRDWLEPEYLVEGTPSFVFRCTAPPPAEALSAKYAYSMFDAAEAKAAFDYCRGLLPKQPRANIDAAEMAYHTYLGDTNEARRLLEGRQSRGEALQGELKQIPPRIRQVAVLKEILKDPSPASAASLTSSSGLPPAEVEKALDELTKLELIRHENANEYVHTVRGVEWINSRFEASAFPVAGDSVASVSTVPEG